MSKKYSWLQRFLIRWSGSVYLEDRKGKDFTGYLPFYAFDCPIHGYVENYPSGKGRLLCPKCIKKDDEAETPD